MHPLVTVAKSDKLYSKNHITAVLQSRVPQCSAEWLHNTIEGYIHDVKFAENGKTALIEVIPVSSLNENKRKP